MKTGKKFLHRNYHKPVMSLNWDYKILERHQIIYEFTLHLVEVEEQEL